MSNFINNADRCMLNNTADILQIELKVSSDYTITGKGQLPKELFEGYHLNVVPKVLEGRVFSNYKSPLVVVLVTLTGSLGALLLAESDWKSNASEFCATLHLLDLNQLKLSDTMVPKDWSRKRLYRNVEKAVVETYRLDTVESDTWQKVGDAAVTEYLEYRDKGRDSEFAMMESGLTSC